MKPVKKLDNANIIKIKLGKKETVYDIQKNVVTEEKFALTE